MNAPLACGPHLRLRRAEPKDAAYIHHLRSDPERTRHLSARSASEESQRDWLRSYQIEEEGGRQLYMVAETRDGAVPCGLVRLYGIAGREATWGSFMAEREKSPRAALEIAWLSFIVAFDRLSLTRCVLDVRRDNARAIAFYRRFGMRETGGDDLDLFFDYAIADFQRDRAALERAIRGAPGEPRS